MDKIEMFLKDLADLTKKHGIVIGSERFNKPFLDDATNSKELASELEYDYDTKTYSVDRND